MRRFSAFHFAVYPIIMLPPFANYFKLQAQNINLSYPVGSTYPSGVIINNAYDKDGILTKKIMGSGTVTTLFTATAMNSNGVYTGYTLGNGKASQVAYNLTLGLPTRYYTPGIQDLNLAWDATDGNLTSRNDAIKNLTETFTYDNLNRLTGTTVNNVKQVSTSFDNTNSITLGNIATKTDAGTYTYLSDKINAVAYITNPAGAQTAPSVISTQTQQIGYTPFLKTDNISQNDYQLQYTYAADQERIKSVLTQSGSVTETKYYLGNYEVQTTGGVTRYIQCIKAGNGMCAIAVTQGGATTMYYVYVDHLGSILTLTDASGNIIAQQNFDAWGRYRNPNDWTYNSIPARPTWLYRGYTGHEHLAPFALINMNGRMYDPVIGRMLSPDNYVQEPDYTQSYNRYTYCINNPLKYNDETGEFFGVDDAIVSAIGFVVGFVEYGISDHWTHIGKALESGLIDAAIAEAGYLTLGGGFAAAANNSATAAWGTGVPFALSYTAASAFTYLQNKDQINDATANEKIGLFAWYSATSAVSAGFASDWMQNKVIDNNLPSWFPHSGLLSGALSQGIGGAISNAGNQIISNDGRLNTGTLYSAFSGFVSSYAEQVAHNGIGDLFHDGFSKRNYFTRALTAIPENFASGITQQSIGNYLSQIGDRNKIKNIYNPYIGEYVVGNDDWWGSWLNGFGGYQSDINTLYK